MSDLPDRTYFPEQCSGKQQQIGKVSAQLTLAAAAAFTAGYIILPAVSALLLPRESMFAGVLAAAGPILSLIILFTLVKRCCGSFRKTMLSLGFRRFPVKTLFTALPLAAAIMLAGGGITLIWGYIGAKLNIDLGTPPTIEAAMSENIWDVIALLITALLAAPVFEEIFFRRVLYGTLLRFVPLNGAIILTSLAFAAMHMSPLQLPGLLVIGWIWQTFYLRSQTLWTSVILHFCNNLIAATMLLLMRFTEFTNI